MVDYQESESYALLSYNRIDGITLSERVQLPNLSRRALFHTITELSGLLQSIHDRGVAHRDLRPDNILIGQKGEVYLIDFDQAVVTDARSASKIDVFGETIGAVRPCVSVRRLMALIDQEREYDSIVSELAAIWRLGAQSDASSPGRNIAYYRWLFGDIVFPGERDWHGRWSLMYGALRDILPGSRVLDLGCNQGLISVHCMLYGAESVTGSTGTPPSLRRLVISRTQRA